MSAFLKRIAVTDNKDMTFLDGKRTYTDTLYMGVWQNKIDGKFGMIISQITDGDTQQVKGGYLFDPTRP